MKETKLVNVCLHEEDYTNLCRTASILGVGKSVYSRILLIKSLKNKTIDFIKLESGKTIYRKKNGYITVKLPVEIYDKLQELSLSYNISVPRIGGYFVSQELNKGDNIL